MPEGHPCGNVYGLAFKLEIHVEGEMDPETGFVIDFGHIEAGIKPIYNQIDHNYLNDIEGLENPTSEVLINGFGKIIRRIPKSWNGNKSEGFKSKLVKL